MRAIERLRTDGGDIEVELHPDGGAARRPDLRRRLGERHQIEVDEVDAELLGAEPGQIEQVGDEPVEPLRFGQQHPADLAGVFRAR